MTLRRLEGRPPWVDPRRGQRAGVLRHHAVCPGLFDTELTREDATPEQLEATAKTFPIRRLGEAVEVADLICFLASEAAGYITCASLDINGGDLML